MKQLIEVLKEHPIGIYGTGFVADRFYQWLVREGLDQKVCLFVVSEGEQTLFHGKPVVNAALCREQLPPDAVLCLAVHEALAETVSARARQAFSGQILWVGGMLQELLFGPVSEVRVLSTASILRSQKPDDLWLALRYALIQQARGCGGEGERSASEFYIRALSLHSEAETAARRLERAKTLADSMAQDGFDREKPILLDQDGRVLDGMHRLAAAVYFGIRELPCKVAQGGEGPDRYLGDAVCLDGAFLAEKGFSESEISFLRAKQQELLCSAAEGGPAVTLILPVYNVADYLDPCMETVTGQTFRDLEILLINDGSTDASLEKCREWEAKDPRIRVITRENRGVAASRNEGVTEAQGEYIAFIDPDDWVERVYIEKLYHRLTATGAAYAECDLWRYDNRTGKKRLRTCYGRMGEDYTLREHMIYCATAPYKSMSRRSLWIDHQIRMPGCSFESPAVYSLVLALAGKVESIREPLYYYRIARENSLIENGYAGKDGSANNTLAIEAMAYLLQEFGRCGLYEAYADTLEEVVRYRLGDILATQFFRKSTEDYRELAGNQRAFLQRAFPGKRNDTYLTWGGYNLNRIMAYVNMLHDPECRFNFSSLVSVMDVEDAPEGASAAPRFSHGNRYRQIMLQRESDRAVWEIAARTKPSYLFLDLIEERFDVLEAGGRYFTRSDAFDGSSAEPELFSGARVIPRLSEECTMLWKKSCRFFFSRLKELVPGIRPVIIENYLSEQVGDPGQRSDFPELLHIRAVNDLLREYYAYLKELCPEAVFVPAWEQPYYFTDRNYQYGAVPSHLNEIVNQKIAEKIGELLW